MLREGKAEGEWRRHHSGVQGMEEKYANGKALSVSHMDMGRACVWRSDGHVGTGGSPLSGHELKCFLLHIEGRCARVEGLGGMVEKMKKPLCI